MIDGPNDFAIEAKGLKKVYRAQNGQPEKLALTGIDLQVPRGSIFGLLGPNGAGKSTFINILAGLVVKTEGTASIWGFDIDKNPRQAKASIGVVPQELNIDPFFTPVEIMDLQAGLYGVPKKERRGREILEALSLGDKADSYTRTLSGGMRRRLLVAKAMVHNPPIIVLDEPTAGVDVELRQQLWEYVVKLNEAGVTIVLTTHYLEEAEELCDTIAIIDKGSVAACEPKAQLLARIDDKSVLITPAAPLVALPAPLLSMGAELTAEGRITMHYSPSTLPMSAILSAVSEAGITIADLTTQESDLEDVFVQITSGADAAA